MVCLGRHAHAAHVEAPAPRAPPTIIHLPIFESMRRALSAAHHGAGLTVADFPREMLETYTNEQMFAAMAQHAESELEYLAIAILGPADELKRQRRN